MKLDAKANVQRFDSPPEVLAAARETMLERQQAYGGFQDVVRNYGKMHDMLGIDKLPSAQRFLVTMLVLKLQRWCNGPQMEQNADSLLDMINYAACLHTLAYPKTEPVAKYANGDPKEEAFLKKVEEVTKYNPAKWGLNERLRKL